MAKKPPEKNLCEITNCRHARLYRLKLSPVDTIEACDLHAKTLSPGTPVSQLERITEAKT